MKFQGLIVMYKKSNCLNKYFLIFSTRHLLPAESEYRNLLGTEWKTGLHWDIHELAKHFTRETLSKWDVLFVGWDIILPSPLEPVTIQTSLVVCKLFTGSWLRTETISFEDFTGKYYCEKRFEGYQSVQHLVLAEDAHIVQRHSV